MRFEHPAALALMLFVLLLLFTRRRSARTRLAVANLYLWREAAANDATSITRRLRRHLLLILQALFLCAVAVAIARPVALDDPAVTLILDTSVSMGARQDGVTRFELAQAAAKSLLDKLSGRTRVRIIAAGSRPREIGEYDASAGAAVTAIDAIRVTDAAADLQAAVEYARAADGRPERIFVFSDAGASHTASAASSDVEWSTVGAAVDNAAVTNLSTRSLETPAGVQVVVGIANHGAAAVDSALTLTHAGAEVARQPVHLSPRSQSSYAFMLDDAVGVLTARLEHRDALLSDNQRTLVVPADREIRVLLTQQRSFFLEKALSAHPKIVIAASDTPGYDLIVCDGCSELPDGIGAASVLLIPPRPQTLQTPVALVKIAADHPVADGVELDGIEAVTVAGDPLPPGSTVIAEGGGIPAVVAYQEGLRRVVEMRLDPDSGVLPFSTALPVLVSNTVQWLVNRDVTPVNITAGEPLQWHVGAQRKPPTVLAPADTPLHSTWSNGILSVSDTSVAGLYSIRLDAGDHLIAVNPAVVEESDLSLLASPPPAARADTAVAAGTYRDVSTVLVLGALLLLAAEWRYRLSRPRAA